jgi:hypothetical protein
MTREQREHGALQTIAEVIGPNMPNIKTAEVSAMGVELGIGTLSELGWFDQQIQGRVHQLMKQH